MVGYLLFLSYSFSDFSSFFLSFLIQLYGTKEKCFTTYTYTHANLQSLRLDKVGELGGNNQTGNRGRGQGREDARNQGRQGKSGDVATTRRRQLAENTNLDTQGANVAKSAESVGGNELRAGRQVGVVGVGGHGVEGIVLILQATRVIIISHVKSAQHRC